MAGKSLRHHAHHIDKRLQFRLRLYFLVSLILVGVLIFNILRGALRIEFGLIGVVAGCGIGILASRMFHTSWDKDAKKVVSRLDFYGIGILILYLIFEISREKIVAYFTHDIQVSTVGFAVLAGIMFGRVLGTRGRIMKIIREQEIF